MKNNAETDFPSFKPLRKHDLASFSTQNLFVGVFVLIVGVSGDSLAEFREIFIET